MPEEGIYEYYLNGPGFGPGKLLTKVVLGRKAG